MINKANEVFMDSLQRLHDDISDIVFDLEEAGHYQLAKELLINFLSLRNKLEPFLKVIKE